MTKYNNDRWDEWMHAALKGDQNAYRLLLTSLRLWLAAYFTKRVHYNAVEDLVQDTLLTLHAKRQTFDPHYSFGPWIAAVARHRWIDHLRATLKYVETQLDDNFFVSGNGARCLCKARCQSFAKADPSSASQGD